MDSSPYVRHGLRATESGRIDVDSLVARWSKSLQELDRGWDEATDLFEHVSALLRLNRAGAQASGAMADAQDTAEADTRAQLDAAWPQIVELARRAWPQRPELAGWLSEIDRLEKSLLEDQSGLETPQLRSLLAARLWQEWDDVELMAAALELGSPERIDEPEDLARRHARFAESPEVFLAASTYIQALGQTIDPERMAAQPMLERTGLKYITALDWLEAHEREASTEGDTTWDDVTFAAWDQYSTPPTIAVAGLAGSWLAASLNLADSGGIASSSLASAGQAIQVDGDGTADARPTWTWHSPDEPPLRATLQLAAHDASEDPLSWPLVLVITNPDETPALQRAGQSARIGGTLLTLDPLAMAVLRLGDLPSGSARPQLWVGDDPEPWMFQSQRPSGDEVE